MSRLRITDNHDSVSIFDNENPTYSHNKIEEGTLNDLRLIANVSIKDLKSEGNTNLWIFPSDSHRYGDKIDDEQILSLQGDRIATRNMMGFVGVNDTQIDIVSRFAKQEEDYFMHYILQKEMAVNLFDLKHDSAQQNVFDFLLYLFPYFLKKALRQGVYKKYRRFEYNDSNVKGNINVNRHIRENIPFRGKIAYSTREQSYDNEVTQLIRHTIEYLRTKELGNAILNNDGETRNGVMQITLATPSYAPQKRNKVICQNIKVLRHPYFSQYTDLQQLCLKILRHDGLKYGNQDNKVYGVLFDGAWLWEEYLNTILRTMDIRHSRNRTGENGIKVFKDGQRVYYPDFYKLVSDNIEQSFVLDAKYKRLKAEWDRNDLFQMITYMHVLPAGKCALLYPAEQATKLIKSEERELNGLGGKICKIGIPIAKGEDIVTFRDFCNKQKEYEIALINAVKDF